MVILVILIQHFPGILCVTKFQVTEFHKKLFPEYMEIPIPVPMKIQQYSPVIFSVTEIHGEFYFHINVHTITIFHDSVFYTQFFSQLHW